MSHAASGSSSVPASAAQTPGGEAFRPRLISNYLLQETIELNITRKKGGTDPTFSCWVLGCGAGAGPVLSAAAARCASGGFFWPRRCVGTGTPSSSSLDDSSPCSCSTLPLILPTRALPPLPPLLKTSLRRPPS
eukprot:2641950-Rhodomonas_salina.4